MERIKLSQNDITMEILNESHMELIKGFQSSCKELEAFLKENALNESQIDFSKTYLFFHKERLVGYVTLLMDKLSLKLEKPHRLMAAFETKTEEGYASIPALKIGRMCVIDEYNSQLANGCYKGLGKIIFASVLDYAIRLKSSVGCRVITTHAKKTTQAYQWYKKMGFVYSHNDEKINENLARKDVDAIPMFYDINRIIMD